jgi:hypothetical protein
MAIAIPGRSERETWMSKAIPQDASVVVADGGKAILLRNTGTGGDLALTEERRLTLKDFGNDGPSETRGYVNFIVYSLCTGDRREQLLCP